jgi:hypothetical protein
LVLPLLIGLGLLAILYVVYIAILHWYITIPIVVIIFVYWNRGNIAQWSAQRRAQKQRRIEEEKRKLQLELEEFRRTEFIRLDRIEQEQKEKKFWDDIRKKLEEQKIVQPALPDYTFKHKPQPRQTKRKSQKTLQDAMRDAFQAKFERKPALDIKKCYKILGLKPEASVLQVQFRFKELALKYHPDRNINSKFAVKKFTEVCEARKIILKLIQVTA